MRLGPRSSTLSISLRRITLLRIILAANMKRIVLVMSMLSLISCTYRSDSSTEMYVCVPPSQQEPFIATMQQILRAEGFSTSVAKFGTGSNQNWVLDGSGLFVRVWVQNELESGSIRESSEVAGVPFRQDLFVVSVQYWPGSSQRRARSTLSRTKAELMRRGHATLDRSGTCTPPTGDRN